MDTNAITCERKKYVGFEFAIFVILCLAINFDVSIEQSLNDAAIQHIFDDIWV